MSLLSVRDLSKAFGGVQAVREVSFDIEAREVVALIGPNGAGKSTCFNALNGQIRPDRGSIRLTVNGVAQELSGMRPRDVWKLGVGRTFQVAATFGSMTVAENVQMALLSRDRRLFGVWKPARKQCRDEALELLEAVGLGAQADRPVSVLAYGDVKSVEIAVALANKPKLLLMDEPTAGMAPRERHALMGLIRRVAAVKGVAVLFTEHSMDVVFAYAQRVLVLARGELIAQGSVEDVRTDLIVQQAYLGSSRTFTARPAASRGQEQGPVASPVARQRARSPAALEVHHLRAWYGRAQILFDVDLRVGEGEVVALIGRNGAGKSTTLKSIVGLVDRVEGAVVFAGEDLTGQPPYRIARRGLGYVPEDRRIFTGLTVMENLRVGRRPARAGVPRWTPQRLFALFPNLAEMTRRPGGRMSGGEQQMLTVARTLMGNPQLVLLDEPSEGVAPLIVDKMAEMIVALKQEGLSVLLSEQNLHFAALVADRAYVLEKGQVLFAGAMSTLLEDDQLRQTHLGM